MTKNSFLIVGGIVVVVAIAIGIFGLATSTATPQVPFPHRMVISGVIAMMAGLFAFVLGFVHTGTIGSKSPSN